jgi:radical SAM superfamily enzyme YgiQ (UPF0313 family)
MRKAPFELFRKLKKRFDIIKTKHELKYEIIPYFISSHPGCTDTDMAELVSEMKSLGIKPEQVQDFTPTPMTLSTLMYYTGFDPFSGKKVYVAKSIEDKRRQKEFFFWYKKDTLPKSDFKKKELRGKSGKSINHGGHGVPRSQ